MVKPADALAFTARWFVENPCERGGTEEMVLQDPFDYEAEDKIIAAWKRLLYAMPEITFKQDPGYGMHYSGPGGRSRTKESFE